MTGLSPDRQKVLTARVLKGIALLDDKRPTWVTDLPRPEHLDIYSGTCCVTAQLSGVDDWGTGKQLLGLTFEEYAAHGFALPDEEYMPGPIGEAEYAFLTDRWNAEIFRRLGSDRS